MSDLFKTEEVKTEVVNSLQLILKDLVSQNKFNMTEKNKILVEYEFMNQCMSLAMTELYLRAEGEKL